MLPVAPSDLRLLDLVLMGILLIALPLWGHFVSTPWRRRKLAAGTFDPVQAYLRSFIMLWGLALLLAMDWWMAGRDPKSLGLAIPKDLRFTVGCLLTAAMMALLVLQYFKVRGLDVGRKRKIVQKNARLFDIIPSSPRQLLYFIGLSITAGVTEELLYRGFLIWSLTAYMGVLAAAVIASILFGLAHAYQGVSGIFKTGVIGLLMAILYVESGTILLPMILHAFLDINNGFLSYSLKSDLAAELPR
ncbi:MAG TPA: CPBP family intramembrane glutamic endopeptidase [Gammaproteobacteria bacterium]|jgi:membrane protease YdiL (CAAX protease family)